MKVKVFYPDKNGRISFTKDELQKLLDEVYQEGYNDGRPYYWTSPYYYSTTPYYTTTSGTNVNITSSNSALNSVSNEIPKYKVEFKSA